MKYWAPFWLLLWVPCLSVLGQTPFERAVEFSDQLAQLDRQFVLVEEAQADQFKQTKEVRLAIQTALQDAQVIQMAGFQQEALTAIRELDLRQVSLQAERSVGEGRRQGRAGRIERSLVGGALSITAGQFLLESSRLSQLLSAQQTTNRRFQQLIAELSRLTEELRQSQHEAERIFRAYRDLADLAGLRTELEYNAAMRQIQRSNAKNLGAGYLRAVLSRRLHKLETAQTSLLELERQSPPHQPLFAAVRAEVIHALGEPSQAQRLLSSVLEANPGLPEGYVTRGLLYAMDNDLRKATNMWQKGLSTQGQEVVLRRNLAIALATRKSANRADRRKALEHAELASQLTLEESWSVEAALALAMHANGEHEDALERIALATDLTSGKCATYCHEIREALEEDQLFAWDFKRF